MVEDKGKAEESAGGLPASVGGSVGSCSRQEGTGGAAPGPMSAQTSQGSGAPQRLRVSIQWQNP